ncbi:MAG: MFS transporter [Jatrophihabitans sp.]
MTLGNRFRRMYAATAASDLSDGIGRTALPLAAAAYTRDPLAVSGLVTFAFLPWLLFALPSGALVDRVDRRVAMAGANVVRAAASGTLAVVVLAHAGGIAVLYAVSFALGMAETVYDSAVRALLPQVVPTAELDRANSLLTVEETLGQTFLGAPIGAALYGVALALPFALNSLGFVLAVVLILTVRGGYRPVRAAQPRSVRHDIRDGVRWLRAHGLLRGLTLISAAQSGTQSMVTGVFVLYVLEVLGLSSGRFGLVFLVAGAGAILGGVATPPLARRFGRLIVLSVGSAFSAVMTGLMAFTHNGAVGATLFALSAAGVMTWNVLTMSMRQALIPQHLFGRVQGAYRTLVWGAIPVGSLLGGALASWLGIRWVFAVAGAISVVLAVVLARLLGRHRALLGDVPDTEPDPVRPASAAAPLSPGAP